MRNGWVNILLVTTAILLLGSVAFYKWGGLRSNQEIQAKRITFRGHSFDWIKVDPTKLEVNLYWRDSENRPYSDFTQVKAQVEKHGGTLLFATNAGIFSSDVTPGGLHIENGTELHALNLRDGEGNFHMKPNGVFFIEGGTASVLESSAYSLKKRSPRIATQSGPMLVIDGKLHPAFTEGSDNRNIRSGVGVDKKGYVHFALSNDRVNFHDFGSLFLEALKCPNALYLDGSISEFYLPALDRTPSGSGYCGIIGVVR
jgi:uncharacterized protein YigE (DUF2233 family)